MTLPIRFAIVGAGRGRSFIISARSCRESVKVTAMCDSDPASLARWKDKTNIRCYTDYEQVLADPEIDAVCLATPLELHARQAIAALEAGKHVLSEVPASYTIEDAWALVEAVERTGLTYMLAENYCFMRDVLMVQNMVEQGVFGELTFADGAYIHDCRGLYFDHGQELTWRGRIRHERDGNTYPTHSLGPVCGWLGINRTDRLRTTATWNSRSRSAAHYAERNIQSHPEYAANSYWAHSDTVTSMIRTENEVLIQARVDWSSSRPHQTTRYGLQGTKAAFTSRPDSEENPLIWIEGRSPTSSTGVAEAWEPLYKYVDEFEHPLWREHGHKAQDASHGGGDYFVIREFAAAINERRAPMIDVYDAVAWSSLTPLSQLSIEQGNAPVEVPDFKGKSNR